MNCGNAKTIMLLIERERVQRLVGAFRPMGLEEQRGSYVVLSTFYLLAYLIILNGRCAGRVCPLPITFHCSSRSSAYAEHVRRQQYAAFVQ